MGKGPKIERSATDQLGDLGRDLLSGYSFFISNIRVRLDNFVKNGKGIRLGIRCVFRFCTCVLILILVFWGFSFFLFFFFLFFFFWSFNIVFVKVPFPPSLM